MQRTLLPLTGQCGLLYKALVHLWGEGGRRGVIRCKPLVQREGCTSPGLTVGRATPGRAHRFFLLCRSIFFLLRIIS